ncbi:DNA-binding IclR family transcriptional regulator, partial [Clostridium algifaecis]
KIQEFYKKFELVKLTENTITDKNELEEQLKEIKKIGYSFEKEETELGLVCVAAPIKQYNGEVIASVTVSAPSNRMTDDKISDIGCELVNVCNEISSKI